MTSPAASEAQRVRAQRVQQSLAAARQRFASLPPAQQQRLAEDFRQADAQAEHVRTYRRPE